MAQRQTGFRKTLSLLLSIFMPPLCGARQFHSFILQNMEIKFIFSVVGCIRAETSAGITHAIGMSRRPFLRIALRERERLPHKLPQPLAQNVVEALEVTRLAITFTYGFVLLVRQHHLVGVSKAAVQHAPLVELGDALPKQATNFFAATANGIGHDLAGPPALNQPNPTLVLAVMHERPYPVCTGAHYFVSSSSTSARLVFARVAFKGGN